VRFAVADIETAVGGGEDAVRPVQGTAQRIGLRAVAADARRDDPSILLYHDCWWVIDPEAGVWCGRGINGQRLLVHQPSRTVVAAVSTWPEKMDDRLSRLMDATHAAITAHLMTPT
jgi:hypothetical protein